MAPKSVHYKFEDQSVDEVEEEQQVSSEDQQKEEDKLQKPEDQQKEEDKLQKPEDQQKMDDKLIKKPEDQQKMDDKLIKKPNDIVYELGWDKRDDLIVILTDYLSLLFGKRLKTGEKYKLIKSNINLYQTLIKLPAKSNELNKNSPNKLNQIILELDYNTRAKIIEILIANQSLSTLIDDLSNDSKLNFIKQNNELICELLKLPVRIIDGNTKETDSDEKKMFKEINGLKSIADNKMDNYLNMFKQEFSSNFMAEEVDEFLESKDIVAKESLNFCCRGIGWWIGLKKVKDLDGDFLSIYLLHNYKKEFNLEWSKGNYELILLNDKNPSKNKKISNQIDLKSTENTYIYNDIKVSFDQLKKEGFIHEDKIKISLNLKFVKSKYDSDHLNLINQIMNFNPKLNFT